MINTIQMFFVVLFFILFSGVSPAQEDFTDKELEALLEGKNEDFASPLNSEDSKGEETKTETLETDVNDIMSELEPGSSNSDEISDQALLESLDDLENLKQDLGEDFFPSAEGKKNLSKEDATPEVKETSVFEVGKEERELLAMAQNIQGQITDTEWNEVATAAKIDSYTVVKNDWLFKISKKLFGSGLYYPKIWSLNTFITNPHMIEPGMVLSFTTGSSSQAPEVKLGTFTKEEIEGRPGENRLRMASDFASFGEDAEPEWIKEKKRLQDEGFYFQYVSEETMDDLKLISSEALITEYKNYEPPLNDFDVIIPNNYDQKTGFDKSSRIFYSFKEGFYLSTFLSTNIVQDFGSIINGPDENIWFTKFDRAFVKFDESVNVVAGDKFSVYSASGEVEHENSDRKGYKYSIIAQIKVLRKIVDKWEVEFIEVIGTPQRGDRITAYTPSIDKITRTYNSRLIEAVAMGSYEPSKAIFGYGDVVYVDRGRADGLELGNVMDVYGFKDRLTKKGIADQPTYKLGELTIITLTDNFATALVTKSKRDFYPGDIAITKSKEAHLRELKARQLKAQTDKEILGGKALKELDVELNLENLNDKLLDQADKIQMTEDELAELDRREREKSIIKESEKDIRALERLENEIESAEKILSDAKLDEDQLLEETNLNDIEKQKKPLDKLSLDEVEEEVGKRYLDENLNAKENPFGLTEFDIEEVDELLNSQKKDNL